MGERSILAKIADALLDKDEETSEDIDREVTTAVKAIKQAKGDVLDGATVLMDSWGEPGDLVYIVDLLPFYDAIGGRDGRLAPRLPEACENVFAQHVAEGDGHGGVEGDFFLMRFAGASAIAGFRKAAEIVNDIGERMMGERFKAIEIPALVVVADVADIVDEHGDINPAKTRGMVKSGGIAFTMDEPDPDDPEWLKLRFRQRRQAAEATASEWHEIHRRKPSDPDWVGERHDRRRVVLFDPSRGDRRKGVARRATDHATEKDW